MKTLHVVGLPHTQVSREFCGCAYTAKILKFCKMMGGGDFIINVYSPEGPAIPGGYHVSVLSNEDRVATFGHDDPSRLPAWPTDEQCAAFNATTIAMLKFLVKPHDLILLTAGLTHKPIADVFRDHLCIEPGVGYEGIFTNKCAFESYAWQHYVYGQLGISDGRCFDAVIPNYFDTDDFPLVNNGHGDYLLYVGRMIDRKGPDIAAQIARACGLPLVAAGAGGWKYDMAGVNYIGPVNVAERATWMAGAKALIVPTTYIEPFGGVAVEAMMCGTPVIASDWGAFPETVKHGLTGYRFRTLRQAMDAVENVASLSPQRVRDIARCTYSLEAVAPMFERWFDSLETLWGDGWFAKR